MDTKKFSTREICGIGIFAAIIIVAAQLSIPMPYGVPMTLQTLAIPLAGAVLGSKNGTFSTMIYVLLGAVGLPVFAKFTGGLGIVLGPTGGFILSFPIMALTAGMGKNKMWIWVGLTIGATVNFLCGMLYYSLVLSVDLQTAFTVCVFPFIPTAIVKIIIVALLGEKLKNVLMKRQLIK